MFKMFWSAFILLSLLTACSSATPTRQNDFTPLTSMRVVATSSKIAMNTSTKLSVIGNFSGLFERDITDQVVLHSLATNFADFSFPNAPARVKGIAKGTATITATRGTVTASIDITVTDATISVPLVLSPLNPSVPKGLTKQFTATGTFSDGSTQDLTFDSVWSSSTPSVASISNDVASKGLATAVASIGTTNISAIFNNLSATTANTVLTATEAVPVSISITPANPSVLSMSSTIFTATGHYSDGTTPDISSKVTWSSDHPAFATIASGGLASTIAQGTTIISANLLGVSATTNLKVTGGTLSGITLSTNNLTLVSGTVARISAIGTFVNGSTSLSRDITGILTWTSDNSAIAAVTTPGGNLAWVNALSTTPATATITAKNGTSGTLSVPVTVNVITPAINANGLTITPASRELTAGTSARFTVQGAFNTSFTQDLTYNASWTSSAGIIAEALNTGIDKGRVKGAVASSTAVTINVEYPGSTTATATVSKIISRTVRSLAVTGPTSLVAGNQSNFTVTATFTDNTTQDVTEDATISIDNANIALQPDIKNQPGAIVAVDSGTASITATFSSVTSPALRLTVQ